MSPAQPDCTSILRNISAYLDGELAVTECGLIDAHCATCESCAAIVAGLRETVGLCRQAGETPLPDDVRARAQASVRRLLEGIPKSRG